MSDHTTEAHGTIVMGDGTARYARMFRAGGRVTRPGDVRYAPRGRRPEQATHLATSEQAATFRLDRRQAALLHEQAEAEDRARAAVAEAQGWELTAPDAAARKEEARRLARGGMTAAELADERAAEAAQDAAHADREQRRADLDAAADGPTFGRVAYGGTTVTSERGTDGVVRTLGGMAWPEDVAATFVPDGTVRPAADRAAADGEMRIITIEGATLDTFAEVLADMHGAGLLYRLRVAVDAEGLKFKFNEGTWSPPYPLGAEQAARRY